MEEAKKLTLEESANLMGALTDKTKTYPPTKLTLVPPAPEISLDKLPLGEPFDWEAE